MIYWTKMYLKKHGKYLLLYRILQLACIPYTVCAVCSTQYIFGKFFLIRSIHIPCFGSCLRGKLKQHISADASTKRTKRQPDYGLRFFPFSAYTRDVYGFDEIHMRYPSKRDGNQKWYREHSERCTILLCCSNSIRSVGAFWLFFLFFEM